MKNSNEMCLPLRMPFKCSEIDFPATPFADKPLIHYYTEMIFVREGALRLQIEDQELLLHEGEMGLVCPGLRHFISQADGASAHLCLLRVDQDRIPMNQDQVQRVKRVMIQAWREKRSMVFPARGSKLEALSDFCVREDSEKKLCYDLSVASGLGLIFTEIIRKWVGEGLAIGACEIQEDPIYSLSSYIQSHLRDGLRVEDLAARCGLSYPWFAKRFREIYGVSCKDYIEQIRVAQVEQYLLFTDLDLARISEETGYADCSHMIKNFKRIIDTTPGQYRMRNRT